MKIKNATKLLTAVSAAALFVAATPEPVKANPVSFYHYTERFSGPVRERFILNMIRNYENAIRRLAPIVERNRHQAWAAKIVANYDWTVAELARSQALIDSPAAVTVVNQTVTTNNFTSQSETPESEVNRIEQIVEEIVNEFVVQFYEL
jgi:hypothetical protein